MSLGEILDRTAQLYRNNFLLFAGIAAVFAGIATVLSLLGIGLGASLDALNPRASQHWVVQLWNGLEILLVMLVGTVAVAANNRAVAWVHLSEPATIGSAYKSVMPYLGRYLWLGLLKTFYAWTPFIVLYAGLLIPYFYLQTKGVLPQPGAAPAPAPHLDPGIIVFGIVALIFVLLFLPVLAICIVVALRYALAVPASVVENLKARAAIRRSIELTKEARGRIFMLWLLVGVIEIGLFILTQGIFVVYAMKHHYEIPASIRVVQQLISFLTTSFVAPILETGTTLFYYDQRVRKEGFDIERMMRAAGLTAEAEPAVMPVSPETGEHA
jgi:hypothetical protein